MSIECHMHKQLIGGFKTGTTVYTAVAVDLLGQGAVGGGKMAVTLAPAVSEATPTCLLT